MSSPWRDLADKTVGNDDTIEKNYPCNLDRQYGYLCLGRKRMLFVSEKGFLRKSYEVLLNAPYDEVTVTHAGRYMITLVHEGKTHQLETGDLSANLVVNAIDEMSRSPTVEKPA